KLLAALENHEVTRVGAHQPSPVDVRLVAATSIDLAQAGQRVFHQWEEADQRGDQHRGQQAEAKPQHEQRRERELGN
ncbi:MAG: sigma 54-interacting transcriptional regulator, partial [Comamonas sp.]